MSKNAPPCESQPMLYSHWAVLDGGFHLDQTFRKQTWILSRNGEHLHRFGAAPIARAHAQAVIETERPLLARIAALEATLARAGEPWPSRERLNYALDDLRRHWGEMGADERAIVRGILTPLFEATRAGVDAGAGDGS